MPLFWIVRENEKNRRSIFIQEAHAKIFAWLHSAIAGHQGKPVEIHELDSGVGRRVPKKMIGRALSQKEAGALLKRMG